VKTLTNSGGPEKNNKKRLSSLGKRTLSNILVVCAGVLLYIGLSNFAAVTSAIRWFFGVIAPFVYAIGLAYLLNMPMRFFERMLFGKFKRKRLFSLLLTYTMFLLIIVLLVWLVVPQVVQSVLLLVRNLPGYLENLGDLAAWLSATSDIEPEHLDFIIVSYADIINSLAEWGRNLLPQLVDITIGIGSGIVGVFTALISSIYMLASKEKMLRQCKRLLYAVVPKKRADSIIEVAGLSNGVFSGFISGKILDSAIIGVMCYVFMLITQMPFAVLISIVIGVTNIVPFFGPFIGAIPSAMILLLIDPWTALWFVVFIILLQQFDGNFLGPKILGNSVGLPAFWVLVSLIVGGGLFGFMGMLLGVPTMGVIYTLASRFLNKRLQNKGVADEDMATAPPLPPSKTQKNASGWLRKLFDKKAAVLSGKGEAPSGSNEQS
jgi:predicted PurR-regulated permease PerM